MILDYDYWTFQLKLIGRPVAGSIELRFTNENMRPCSLFLDCIVLALGEIHDLNRAHSAIHAERQSANRVEDQVETARLLNISYKITKTCILFNIATTARPFVTQIAFLSK